MLNVVLTRSSEPSVSVGGGSVFCTSGAASGSGFSGSKSMLAVVTHFGTYFSVVNGVVNGGVDACVPDGDSEEATGSASSVGSGSA
jgi:hypothetical protein